MTWKKVGERRYQNEDDIVIVGLKWVGGADWKVYGLDGVFTGLSAGTLARAKEKVAAHSDELRSQ